MLHQKFPTKQFIVFALVILLITGCSSNTKPQEFTINNGYLDLTGYDPTQTPKVVLRGEWKFKWQEDNPDFINPAFDDSRWDTYTVPRHWQNKTGTNEGYAWYRLKIKLKPSSDLGIFIRDTHTGYRFYVNGKELASNGTPGTSKTASIPNHYPIVEKLPEPNLTSHRISPKYTTVIMRKTAITFYL